MSGSCAKRKRIFFFVPLLIKFDVTFVSLMQFVDFRIFVYLFSVEMEDTEHGNIMHAAPCC